jgi:polyphosphate kinase
MFEYCYQGLLLELKEKNIYQLTEKNLTNEHREELSNYFHSELKHEIVPIILNPKLPFPKLRDTHIYLAVRLEKENSKKPFYALIQIPSTYQLITNLQFQTTILHVCS